MLPDDGKLFMENFVNLAAKDDEPILKNTDILKNRATGLISYYRGGSKSLMPKFDITDVSVPMGPYMFQKYSEARTEEVGKKKNTKKIGATLFDQAIAEPDSGFLTLSRAACNWVFPEGIDKPKFNDLLLKKLEGVQKEEIIATDAAYQTGGGEDDAEAEEEEAEAEAEADAEVEAEEDADEDEEKPTDLVNAEALVAATRKKVAEHFAKAESLDKEIQKLSPKYYEIITRLRASPGPALVYSNYKTFEGLGLFTVALEAEGYLPLAVVQEGGRFLRHSRLAGSVTASIPVIRIAMHGASSSKSIMPTLPPYHLTSPPNVRHS